MKLVNFEDLIEKYKWPLGLGILGLILVGAGIFLARLPQDQPTVEIISPEAKTGPILVDLEGAVLKPGVYEFENGARINDLLIKAGGLSVEADRDWVAKNLNLAQKLVDGAKIYVPVKNAQSSAPPAAVAGATNQINLNSAGASELATLWGIGEKRAADIISSRPYQTIDELLTKAKIPQNVYDRIKDLVSCY